MPVKILMVCLGNICRSPMAEGIMQAKIKKYKLDAEVDSAGFEPFHAGDAPDFRAIRVMKQHGIDISGQRSRVFRASDFDAFDRIFVMDSENYRDVKSAARHEKYDHAPVGSWSGSLYSKCSPIQGNRCGRQTQAESLQNRHHPQFSNLTTAPVESHRRPLATSR